MMRPQVSRTGVLALWSVLLLLGAATGHAQNGPKNGPAPASTGTTPPTPWRRSPRRRGRPCS